MNKQCTEKFEYKDSRIIVRHGLNPNPATKRTCFCCIKAINKPAVLLVNNHKYFPNIAIHEDCFNEWKNKMQELCSDIETSYQHYKQLENIFDPDTR